MTEQMYTQRDTPETNELPEWQRKMMEAILRWDADHPGEKWDGEPLDDYGYSGQ